MELIKQQAEFARDVSNLIHYIFDQGYLVTFGEAYRTPEQAAIYAKEGKGIVHSLHCQRLAIDLNIFSSNVELLREFKDWEIFGKYWTSLNPNNRWGGTFKPLIDMDHFQRSPI